MGNKGISTPLPKYESAQQQLTQADLAQLRSRFLKLSGGGEVINLDILSKITPVQNYPYLRKFVFPKFFLALDIKRDGVLDFEEFVCGVAFFRNTSLEDHIRFLYVMYDTGKSSNSNGLSKDCLRQVILDATIVAQKEEISLSNLETWITSMAQLSEAMVETAFIQFSSQSNKMDMNEFINFVKVEGTIQSLLMNMPTYLGDAPVQYL